MFVESLRTGFYGWRIVAASFLILFVTVGIGLYVPPVFLVPLQTHFGWSRAAIATGSAIAAAVSGLVSPVVGVCIDRYGSRLVMTASAVVMGVAFGLFALMESLWQLYAINALAAVGITGAAWIPNQTLISNWFTRKRGLAMGVALTGIGFGGLVMAPLADQLIARLGWRYAFAGLSASILVVVVTAILAVVRSRPTDLGLRPDGETIAVGVSSVVETIEGLPLSRSLRTGAFWILSLANFLMVFASLSLIAHLVAFLRDTGFESQTAAGTLGLTVGVSVGGRVLFGVLADRFSKRNIMCLAIVLYAAATSILFRIEWLGALPAFVLAFGIALGGTAVLMPLLVGECFGLHSFGKVLGLIMISGTAGAAFGPVLTGRIYDVTGSYTSAFGMHIAAFLMAAVAMGFLSRPRTSAAD